MKANVTALSRTWENSTFKTAKPLFIGSIPIAASIKLNNFQPARKAQKSTV